MSDTKKPVELNESDLEKVNGGRAIMLGEGKHISVCPFSDCGCTFVKEMQFSDTVSSYDVEGVCTCSAEIRYKTTETAEYTRNGEKKTTAVTFTA